MYVALSRLQNIAGAGKPISAGKSEEPITTCILRAGAGIQQMRR